MGIPTEPIGSIPRPIELIAGISAHAQGALSEADLQALYDKALSETIERMEATGAPVVTDGEQTKPSFATYPIGPQFDGEGIHLPFADGHTRQLPRLVQGPFRYAAHADTYLRAALGHAKVPVKQAVIAPSALCVESWSPPGQVCTPIRRRSSSLKRSSTRLLRSMKERRSCLLGSSFTASRPSVKSS